MAELKLRKNEKGMILAIDMGKYQYRYWLC